MNHASPTGDKFQNSGKRDGWKLTLSDMLSSHLAKAVLLNL